MLQKSYQHYEEGEINYDHIECGDTRQRLYVRKTRKGWLYFCHNCALKGFQKSGNISTASETLKALEGILDASGNKTINTSNISLPSDFSICIPSPGLSWLYKYGITDEEISRYHFGYSERMKRLILPVYNQKGELVYFQGRNLGQHTKITPKYINIKTNKPTLALYGKSSKTICIVEDILSAIRVGRELTCIPLLGSYISTPLILSLNFWDKIILWLDFDKRFEALKYTSKIKLYTGKETKTLITKLDPKEYSDLEIQQYIKGVDYCIDNINYI